MGTLEVQDGHTLSSWRPLCQSLKAPWYITIEYRMVSVLGIVAIVGGIYFILQVLGPDPEGKQGVLTRNHSSTSSP